MQASPLTGAVAAHPLVILGMHRSGTSLLTGLLALGGVWVGAEDELTAANEENPKGFWERRDLRAICDALLQAAGAEWWRPGFDPETLPGAVRETQLAAWRQLVAELDARGRWAVKEPRLCLVLPLLLPALAAPACLHIHRNPLEVARSLAARNGFGILEGLALWEAYTRRALAASAGLPRAAVLHADLAVDPAAALAALSLRLEAAGAPGLPAPAPAALTGFVVPDLYRQHATEAEAAALLAPEQARLWAALQAGDWPEPGDLSPAACQVLADLDRRKMTADALRTETARRAMLTERLAAAGAARHEMKAELRAARAAGAALAAERDRAQGAAAAAAKTFADRAQALEAALAAERDRTQALDETLAATQREARRHAAARAAGEAELGRLRRDQARMLKSTSWRVTAPLRAAGDALKRARRQPWRLRLSAAPVMRAASRWESLARLMRGFDRWRCRRLVARTPLFDPAWYLAEYPEIAAAGLDPLRHFLDRGRREGRNPSAGFDTVAYMTSYPDVARSGLNPLVHYLRQGRREGRQIRPAAARPISAEATAFDPAAAAAWAATLRADPAHAGLAAGPLVSIVLPTRDRIRLLPAAIGSILAQSYANWELIVVDDGSTDGTAETLRARFDDPRIRVIATPGLGVSGARNAGLAVAAGALVAYLDSDNAWMPDYLELMVAEFARSGAASVYAVLKVRGEDGSEPWYRAVAFDYERLRFSNYIDLNVFMHRAALFGKHGGFDLGLRRAVDWDLILRYVKTDPVSFAYFVGAEYDHSDRKDRLTVRELYAFKNVVRNKHWIDWQAETARLAERDPDLVSVIVSIQSPLERAEERLRALFAHPAGRDFELILVDNGCDAVSKAILSDWRQRQPAIRVVEVRENVQRALGRNLGLAASSGATVVFLDEQVEVAPEWLRPLVRPLQDAAVKGVQPKILAADGTIHAAGLAFPETGLAYPLYAGLPGDFEPSNRPRALAAVSGLCAAFRAADLVAVHGFHPIYTSELEDVDLCLRLGGGAAVFRYVPDAVVRRHPGGLRIREARIAADRRQFRDRWPAPPADAAAQYAADELPVPQLLPDRPAWVEEGLALWRPERPAAVPRTRPGVDASALGGRTVALKIGCPRPEVKDNWGDYHFAAALAAALLRKGVRARIDFAAAPDRDAAPDDINLVVRGRQRFEPKPDTVNLLWLISHPDRPGLEELRGFDHVFVASEVWARQLAKSGLACQALLQCTDSARFYPMPADPALASPALFVANSRNVLRSIVREAIEQGLPIDIYGEMWEGLAPAEWIRAAKIDNVDLPRYYASAEVVLNDHWDSMREGGFVSNRIFDVLACATPLVTDRIAGLPDEIAACCHVFGEGMPLAEAVAAARRDRASGRTQALRVAELVRRHHSFDARAETIVATILAKLAGKRVGNRLAG